MILLPLLLLLASFSAQAPASADTQNSLSQSPDTVGAYVRQYYAGTPILADIAWCESRMRQWNPDGTAFRGSVNNYDVGVMQINELYHAEKAIDLNMNIYSLAGNLQYAKYLYEKEGTKPWASSEVCWDKLAQK